MAGAFIWYFLKEKIFMRDRVHILLEDVYLFGIELPYRHDLSVILEKMMSTDPEIHPDTPRSLYKLVNVAMTLFDHERVRDLIFTHCCGELTTEEVSRLLREAIVEGNLNMVRLLLPLNPNFDAIGKEDMSALWGALVFCHVEIAKELIRAGANVNETAEMPGENRETPINYAISKNLSDELIDLLIEHGANINATEEPLKTPLVYAVQYRRLYVIKRLLNCGARMDFNDTIGCRLLYIACQNKRAEEILPILLQHNIEVNAKDDTGANALHHLILCRSRNVAAGELLLRNGVSLVNKNNHGWTPLQVAVQDIGDMAYLYLRYFAKFIVIDKRFCDEDRDFLRSYPLYKTYFEECLKEFERMKEIEIYNHIKFSCFFSKSIRKLTNLVRNGDFLKTYEKFNIHKLFPTLQPHLENIMTIVIKNCEILRSAEEKLTPIFSEYLPILVINKIAYCVAVDKLNLM